MRTRKNRNRYHRYMLVLAACHLLYGCVFEHDPAPPGKRDATYVTLWWKQAIETRPVASEEAGSQEESVITNATVWFFNKNSALVNRITENDIVWHFQEGTGYVYTEPIRLKDDLPAGDYRVYVTANETGVTMPENGSLETFAGLYEPADVSALFISGNFFMANRQNEITTDTNPQGGVWVSIRHGHMGTYENPVRVEVSLERLAAKVTVEEPLPGAFSIVGTPLKGTDNTSATISEVVIDGFALINCVNRFYLIQQWKRGGKFTTADSRDRLLVSPSSSTAPLYPLDGGYYNRIPGPLDFKETGTPLYCLENNSPYYVEELGMNGQHALPKTKMKGRTTAVVFRAKATLSTGGDHTFYRYAGTLYSTPAALTSEHPDITGTTAEALRAQGVEVFENGTIYYTEWIKDFNYTDGGDPYHTVIRNTWYKLGIKDIIDIGGDVPGGKGYKDTDPIDAQSAILVTLKINAWNVVPENVYIVGE